MVPAQLLARSQAHPHGFRNISPDTAHEHLSHLTVIDVREHDEFVGPLGAVRGARLVPLSTIGHEAPKWNTDAPVLVICRSGGRSSAAAAALARMGFRSVFNLDGGMLAWNASALPVARPGALSEAA